MARRSILLTLAAVIAAAAVAALAGGYWMLSRQETVATTVTDSGLQVFRASAEECARQAEMLVASECLNRLVIDQSPILGTPTVYQGSLEAINKHEDKFANLCHRNFHYMGQYAGRTVLEDIDSALALGGPECEFGFFHGVVEGRAAAISPEQLWQEMPTICAHLSSDRNSYAYQECSHSLGHAVDEHMKTDVPAGVEKCRLLETDSEVSACATGVFMSWSNKLDKRIQAREPIDGIWQWAPAGERYIKCPEFDDVIAGACALFFAETVEHTPEGFGKFRAWCHETFQGRTLPLQNCHLGVGRVSGGYVEFKAMGEWDGIVKFCLDGYDYEFAALCAQSAYGTASGFQKDPKLVDAACAAWKKTPHADEQCKIVRDIFNKVTASMELPGDQPAEPAGSPQSGPSESIE